MMGITEDTKIVTTPRVVVIIIGACFTAYFWLSSTFLSKVEAQSAQDIYIKHSNEVEARLDQHIMSSSMYRVEADISDTRDKLWLLNEQMLIPEGNTTERRLKAHEYQQRIAALENYKTCLATQHTGCEVLGD